MTDTIVNPLTGYTITFLEESEELLEHAQRYAMLREEQTADLTLGWPVIRRAASSRRLSWSAGCQGS